MDRGKLDHKSVPGVIVEVTEHDNYRIACKGGVLKDCLGGQRCQVENIKRVKHYDLQEAFDNWKFMRKISIREALTFISKMGGQGFFFCNCKGNCDKNTCNARKIIGNATANATPPTLGALTTIDVMNTCN